MYVLLSRTQAGPGRTVKQEQDEISRNHLQTFISPSVHHDHVDKLCKTVAPHWQKPVQKQQEQQQMAGRAGIGFALSPDQCELGLLASPLASLSLSLSLFLSYLSGCGPYVFRSTQRLSIKL